ncbi:MAG: hypothetical protein PHW93_03565 [Candidatus Methanomethylophilaceae archaeon]|nr:hypothetical protein [Candidatus Methanomethylophilaceae archaeon]
MMKVRVAYMTYLGNNQKAAEALRDELSDRYEVDLVSISEGASGSGGADLVVVCSPVRMGNLVRKSRRFLKSLAKEGGLKYALVVTHASELTDEKFNPIKPTKKWMAILDEAGNRLISEPLYLQVTDIKGSLKEGYEQKIEQFASNL